jgi:hypothetical protein
MTEFLMGKSPVPLHLTNNNASVRPSQSNIAEGPVSFKKGQQIYIFFKRCEKFITKPRQKSLDCVLVKNPDTTRDCPVGRKIFLVVM